MKKLLSILIAVMICCAVTVTTFAATPDETPAKDMQAIIKQAMLDNYYTDTKPTELEIRIVGGNENGSVYFEHTDNLSHTSAAYETQLGNYTYSYTAADELLVYNNGKIYTMKNAYESGVIDDSILEELSKMNFGLESNKPNTTVPTEPTTTVAIQLPQLRQLSLFQQATQLQMTHRTIHRTTAVLYRQDRTAVLYKQDRTALL